MSEQARVDLDAKRRMARRATYEVLSRWAAAIAARGGMDMVPETYRGAVKPFAPVLFDGNCGCPLAWGFEAIERIDDLNDPVWNGFSFKFVGYGHHNLSRWAFVCLELTYDAARAVLGDVTGEDRGPLGGFRSITFGGDHQLFSRQVDPRGRTRPWNAEAWDRDLLPPPEHR